MVACSRDRKKPGFREVAVRRPQVRLEKTLKATQGFKKCHNGDFSTTLEEGSAALASRGPELADS
jgi:hypothetical protein